MFHSSNKINAALEFVHYSFSPWQWSEEFRGLRNYIQFYINGPRASITPGKNG